MPLAARNQGAVQLGGPCRRNAECGDPAGSHPIGQVILPSRTRQFITQQLTFCEMSAAAHPSAPRGGVNLRGPRATRRNLACNIDETDVVTVIHLPN
jgi:hypothetical protein